MVCPPRRDWSSKRLPVTYAWWDSEWCPCWAQLLSCTLLNSIKTRAWNFLDHYIINTCRALYASYSAASDFVAVYMGYSYPVWAHINRRTVDIGEFFSPRDFRDFHFFVCIIFVLQIFQIFSCEYVKMNAPDVFPSCYPSQILIERLLISILISNIWKFWGKKVFDSNGSIRKTLRGLAMEVQHSGLQRPSFGEILDITQLIVFFHLIINCVFYSFCRCVLVELTLAFVSWSTSSCFCCCCCYWGRCWLWFFDGGVCCYRCRCCCCWCLVHCCWCWKLPSTLRSEFCCCLAEPLVAAEISGGSIFTAWQDSKFALVGMPWRTPNY